MIGWPSVTCRRRGRGRPSSGGRPVGTPATARLGPSLRAGYAALPQVPAPSPRPRARLVGSEPPASTDGRAQMDANEALADLTQISVQISNALIQAADGSVLGSTLGEDSSQRLARLARELWEAADRTRGELGRDELAHLEVATPEGSVFLVHDGVRSIVATTSSDPTVGLVFYDLKACLRAVAESDR